MKKRLPVGLASIVLAAGLAASAAAQQAPDFALSDSDGNTVRLSDYAGKALILHFWATWCPYCKRLQPGLDSLYRDFQLDGLELLGISILEGAGAKPQEVLRQRGHSFKTAINGNEVAKAYGVKGTPTTFFISRKGHVIWQTNNSDPDDPRFEQAAEYILNN